MIRSGDTSAETHARQLEAWRQMTPEERLAAAAEMSDALPGWSRLGFGAGTPNMRRQRSGLPSPRRSSGPSSPLRSAATRPDRPSDVRRARRGVHRAPGACRDPVHGHGFHRVHMIVAKLEWAAATDSERQLRDVAGMLAVGGDHVDRDYVVRSVDALGLREVWRRVSD